MDSLVAYTKPGRPHVIAFNSIEWIPGLIDVMEWVDGPRVFQFH